jgi:hypothetical protein
MRPGQWGAAFLLHLSPGLKGWFEAAFLAMVDCFASDDIEFNACSCFLEFRLGMAAAAKIDCT